MELNNKLFEIDRSNSDLLEELQKVFSQFSFSDTGTLTRFNDPSDLTDLCGGLLNQSERDVNTVINGINLLTSDLKTAYNEAVISIDTSLTEAKKTNEDIGARLNKKKFRILFNENFNSGRNLNLNNSTCFVDYGLGQVFSGIEQLSPISFVPVLNNKTTSSAIYGCNALATSFSVDQDNGNVTADKIPNNSFSILNITDGDPLSCFEAECYYIKDPQNLKKSNSYYYSQGSPLSTISNLFDPKTNVMDIYENETLVTKPVFNFTKGDVLDTFYLGVTLVFTKPERVNSVNLRSLLRAGFNTYNLVYIKGLIKGEWVTLKGSTVVDNESLVVTFDSNFEIETLEFLFSTQYKQTDYIYREFRTTKFLRKSTRNHGFWRTVDKWESWERSVEPLTNKTINIYQTTLLSAEGVTSLPQSSFRGTEGKILDPLQLLVGVNTVLDGVKDVKNIGSIVKIATGASTKNLITANGLPLGGVGKQGLSSKAFSSLVGSALNVYAGAQLVSQIVQSAFSYNHQDTAIEGKTDIPAFDIFQGFRAGIAIKDIELASISYIKNSQLLSNKIKLTESVTELGVYLDSLDFEGVDYTIYLSRDGSNWLQATNIKKSPDSTVKFDKETNEVFYRVDINSILGNTGIIDNLSLVTK